MSTVPADSAGTSTVMLVALFTVKHGALPQAVVTFWLPTDTSVVMKPEPSKPVPVTVRGVPPLAGPLVGDTLVTVGTGAKVYASAAEVVLVPPGVATVMSTVPTACPGKSMTV